LHNERTGYPTQKPEALIKRIILASSNPGDLVADFFCGSGTTPYVAAQTGRRFIAVDDTLRAIHTAKSRLVRLPSLPFSIYVDSVAKYKFKKPNTKPRFSVGENQVTLAGETKGIDYWEVDPDWDGMIFRSMNQAIRPLRSGDIPNTLKIKTGRRICVRFVLATGIQYQVELNV
jgi:hypothetical protein